MAKIEGDEGEIKALGEKLDAIHHAIKLNMGLMSGGAVVFILTTHGKHIFLSG